MQQVSEGLMDREFSIAYPGLGQKPVPLVIAGQEDGAVGPWCLAELVGDSSGEGGYCECQPFCGFLPTYVLPLSPTQLQTWMARGSRGPRPGRWYKRVIGAAEN
jgi:hypothetical protein